MIRKFTVYSLQFTVVLILFLSTVLYPQSTVSAHLFGQPPFFLINGKYSNLYHVPLTSISDFALPQDGAPDNYLVNQELKMGFDITRLPAPPEVVKKTQFTWDFGDGTKGSGLNESHTYKKMGSYILSVDAFDGTTPAPQLLESVLINVLPSKNYQLPKAVILVNNRKSADPLTDILQFPLDKPLQLDAGDSTVDPSAKIVSYFWDFGDQQSGTTSTATHSYPPNTTQIFPVLRIKDSNGFIADEFVEVKKGPTASGGTLIQTSPKHDTNKQSFNFTPYILGAALLVVLGALVKSRSKRSQ